MQEKWPERPALPAVDFRKDLLQPVTIGPNPVPRYKRVPVAQPELCADVADHIFEMCYQQEVMRFPIFYVNVALFAPKYD